MQWPYEARQKISQLLRNVLYLLMDSGGFHVSVVFIFHWMLFKRVVLPFYFTVAIITIKEKFIGNFDA